MAQEKFISKDNAKTIVTRTKNLINNKQNKVILSDDEPQNPQENDIWCKKGSSEGSIHLYMHNVDIMVEEDRTGELLRCWCYLRILSNSNTKFDISTLKQYIKTNLNHHNMSFWGDAFKFIDTREIFFGNILNITVRVRENEFIIFVPSAETREIVSIVLDNKQIQFDDTVTQLI